MPINANSLRIAMARSNVSQHELDTVYNIDAMTQEAFLKYNQSQLHNIALGRDRQKKLWLFNYLKTFSDSTKKRTLLQLLQAGQRSS